MATSNALFFQAWQALQAAEKQYVTLADRVLAGDRVSKLDLEAAALETTKAFEHFMKAGNILSKEHK